MKKKIIYFVTEDWYFWSHRLPIARAARDAGFEVVVVTRVNKHGERIENEGFKLIPIHLERRGRSVVKELRVLFDLVGIYNREKPDMVHNVAVKPVIYGSIAAFLSRVPMTVNALAGLGYIFVNRGLKAVFLRRIFILVYKIILSPKTAFVIFQNPEDRELFVKSGSVDKKRTILIRGSGVDISTFKVSPEPEGVITIMLASRMLWDKGVGELVHAAKVLHQKGIQCRIVLVGQPDDQNPNSIPVNQLQRWNDEEIIEWWGYQENMAEVLTKSHIVVLPSYREGVPKVLIEAAACGRPVVTTDVPGCREIVSHNINGILVPAKDSELLADALIMLINDSDLRIKMGERGREIVQTQFSDEIVIKQTLNLYNKLSVN